MIERLLFDTKWAHFQPYYGVFQLLFNEMMMFVTLEQHA